MFRKIAGLFRRFENWMNDGLNEAAKYYPTWPFNWPEASILY